MDTKRLILYALLGIVVYSLWTAWQKDYAPVQVPTTATATSPAATASASAVAADSALASATKPAAEGAIRTKAPEHRLIQVQTDVLDISIDTLGGQIVKSKLLKYPVAIDKPEPLTLLNDDPQSLYVASVGFVKNIEQAKQPIAATEEIKYKAAQTQYILPQGEQELAVELKGIDKKGVSFTKIFTFKRGHYDIKVSQEVKNTSRATWIGRFYTALQRKNVPEQKGKFIYSTFTGAAISSPEKLYEKISYKKMAQENLERNINGGWLSFQQHYFLNAWIPPSGKTYNYFSRTAANEIYTLGLTGEEMVLRPGEKTTVDATLYGGPEIAADLAPLAKGLDLTVDYGWLWIISKFLFWLMQQIYKVVGNWGWAIIGITVLIKLAFFKLSESSYLSMAKMKDLGPKIKALKEKFGADRQKLSQATMELYRKEKVNPLGGCLPMLLQIPVFIGLYYVLIEAVQLRQAPFVFWIHDLAAQDPYYILPILMGLSMLLQQRMSPQSPDPMQAKMMMLLPVVFTIFFLSFPAGLVLYWLVNNCLSVLQQWYINKKHVHGRLAVGAHSHKDGKRFMGKVKRVKK